MHTLLSILVHEMLDALVVRPEPLKRNDAMGKVIAEEAAVLNVVVIGRPDRLQLVQYTGGYGCAAHKPEKAVAFAGRAHCVRRCPRFGCLRGVNHSAGECVHQLRKK